MPRRRAARGHRLVGLLVVALGLAMSAGPAAALDAPPIFRAHSLSTEQHRPPDPPNRLRGGLARLVRAAQSGAIDREMLRGFEVASVPHAASVGVSLQLARVGGEDALSALIASGARVVNRSGQTAEAYLPSAALRTLGTLAGIARADPIIRPVSMGSPGLGAVVGEGVKLHGADQWQAAGILGAGIKVGIIDGGFVGLTSRIGRELPMSVFARCYREVGRYSAAAKSCEENTEHGTAVAETIADMAPGISLYLANPVSMLDLKSSVAWMTSNGVQVINVSLGFAYEGPGDGTSPPNSVYSVVDQAVAGGALWVNAAGNAGEDGWTGTWTDTDQNGVLEFSGTDERNSLVLTAGDPILVTLRWNDRWGASGNDYNLYLYGADGALPLATSEDTQNGRGDPVETLSFTPSTSGAYRLAVKRSRGSDPSALQLLVLMSNEAPLQFRTAANTLPSPADSANPGMITVGAVSFGSPDSIQPYSSRGPTTDGRIKPDVVAADCTATTLISPFCGTSESAPYASGAAALSLAVNPSLTPAQLATWLRSRAIPLGGPTPNATFGWGRLDLGVPPETSLPAPLAFAAQPAVAVSGELLSPAPALALSDAQGRGLTSPVTLSLGVTAVGSILTCSGGLTRNAVAGLVSFAGCAITGAAGGVILVATTGTLPAATSAPFDVLPAGSAPSPGLTISSSAAVITWGAPATLQARLAPVPGTPLPSPLGGRTITIEVSGDGLTWRIAGRAVSDDSGLATFNYRPAVNLLYRGRFAGTPDLGAAVSGPTRVTVRQTVALRPANGGGTRVVGRDAPVEFTTLVRPARSGLPVGTVTYAVYQRVGTTWKLVLTRSVTPDSQGVAALAISFGGPGRWYVRSRALPTARNANSTWSPAEQFMMR